MSPLAAVCRVHGAFESRLISANSSVNVTMVNNRESCPKCGRLARVVDGQFSFDGQGFATVVSAPAWSRAALDSVQSKLIKLESVLRDPEISDTAATEWYQKTIDELRVENAGLHAKFAALLVSKTAKKPRTKKAVAVMAFLMLLNVVSNTSGFVDGIDLYSKTTERAIQWVIDAAEAGRFVEIQDYPLKAFRGQGTH